MINMLTVTVRGAGVQGVNGDYDLEGVYNRRPFFSHVDPVFGEQYYLYATLNGWMIVSSRAFPSPGDVAFYQCHFKHDMDRLLPPARPVWFCSARVTLGMRELLKPAPDTIKFKWRVEPHEGAIHLAALISTTEMAEDRRPDGKAISPRNKDQPVCAHFLAQVRGCPLKSSECEYLHVRKARETALAAWLLLRT